VLRRAVLQPSDLWTFRLQTFFTFLFVISKTSFIFD
jgi:hypothetical protein